MIVGMLIILVAIVLSMILLTRRVIADLDARASAELETLKQQSQHLELEKSRLSQEKTKLESATEEIFALYDITKSITKSFDGPEAIENFKVRLKERISFQECRFYEPDSAEIQKIERRAQDFFFHLQSQEDKLGVLVIHGLSEADKDKATILGHQLALALRRIKLYQELEQLAITDSLTTVHTRQYFLKRFEEELQRVDYRKGNLSFLMIDVDYFKNFNDQYGHLVGDQILRKMGSILKENIREIDIVGRYGGEEFSVVLPDTDQRGAYFVAERIRSATEKTPIKSYDTTVSITISVGLSTSPPDGRTSEQLIEKADQALYEAKRKGRNRIFPSHN